VRRLGRLPFFLALSGLCGSSLLHRRYSCATAGPTLHRAGLIEGPQKGQRGQRTRKRLTEQPTQNQNPLSPTLAHTQHSMTLLCDLVFPVSVSRLYEFSQKKTITYRERQERHLLLKGGKHTKRRDGEKKAALPSRPDPHD
jgi:hypothetical protein